MHLPRTVSRFGSQAAADVLSRHLEQERDEAVGHKILRGLGRLVAENDHIRTDPDMVERSLTAALTRAITLLGWRLTIADTWARRPRPRLDCSWSSSCARRRRHGPSAPSGCSGCATRRRTCTPCTSACARGTCTASGPGGRLVEHLVTGPMRDALLALVAQGDRERLELAAPFAPPAAVGLAGALREMMFDPSDAVVGLAAHHIGELNADNLTRQEGSEMLASLEQRTGSWIEAANQALLAMRAVDEPLAG